MLKKKLLLHLTLTLVYKEVCQTTLPDKINEMQAGGHWSTLSMKPVWDFCFARDMVHYPATSKMVAYVQNRKTKVYIKYNLII